MTGRRRLRAAGPGDGDFLTALFAATRAGLFAAAGLPDDELASLLAMQWQAQQAGHAHTNPAAVDSIVEMDGTPIGRVLVEWQPAEAHLVDIALLPDWTGRGIGGAVIRDLVEHARSRDCAVVLSVARDNLGASALYRRLGFVEDDARSTSPTHLALRHS